MNEDIAYRVGFSKIPGVGRVRLSQLQSYFHSLKDAWTASHGELRRSGLDRKTAESIVQVRGQISLDDEMAKLEKQRVAVISCDSPDYPPRLREIYDYPPVLYVKGKLTTEDDHPLAVVGTRRPTIYGRQVAEEFAAGLARNGIMVVSGLARGIDSIAHRAALEAGGKTIAVFASGLDIIYPAENARLAGEIAEHGAIVSEYPLETKPRAENFPRRNRIMSGLSLGVLVIEAGETSGALITASMAVEQDREVFAVPGSILSPMSRGTNRLIQEGAKLVRNCDDILEELNLGNAGRQLEMKTAIPANETESQILELVGSQPVHVDDICRRCSLPVSEVSSALAMMELRGIVKQMSPMNYART